MAIMHSGSSVSDLPCLPDYYPAVTPRFICPVFSRSKYSRAHSREAAISIPRQVLVVMQFTVSLCLIIGTIIVYKQILFTKDRPTGYTRDRLVTMPLTTELGGHYDALHESSEDRCRDRNG